MSEELLIPEAMRGEVKLIRHIGDVWGRFKVNVKNSAESHSQKEVDIFLGCLKNNWKLTSSLNTEEIPWSCTTGKFTLAKEKNYKVSVETRNLPPMLQAALLGQKITGYFEGTGEKILVQEKVNIAAVDFASSGMGIDLASAISGLAYDNVVKIISVKQKSNGVWWSQGEVPSSIDKTFIFTEGESGVIGTDNAPLLEINDESLLDEEFTILVQYERGMKKGEFVLSEDGSTFPETVDLYLYWLVKVETGPNRGKKGGLIAVAKNCMRTGDLEIGGDTQGISSQNIEFAVNIEDDGDLSLHFYWLD